MERAAQNRALRDLEELVATVMQFEPTVRSALLRNRHSGQGIQEDEAVKGGLTKDRTRGIPAPSYGDPTGEEGIFLKHIEDVGNTLNEMAAAMRRWHDMAKWVLELSNTDPAKRAQRTVPDCMACGDPCHGRVRSGFDDKCYKRWTRGGRPDRRKFIEAIKAQKAAEESQ